MKNYNLAPTIVSMEMKLSKSEYDLCILKVQNSNRSEKYLCIRCICFTINIDIKGKLPEL